MLTAVQKQEIVKNHQRKENDCGSTEVQIALLTARIKNLQEHFTAYKKDVHSLLGLRKMVAARRKLLKYLKIKDLEKYRALLAQLEIRG
jgi:small subunit ribosomal protein S15